MLFILRVNRPEDLVKAMESCQRKMFLGFEMDISLYEGNKIMRYRIRTTVSGNYGFTNVFHDAVSYTSGLATFCILCIPS